ncbi:MAG: HAMP domain-containing histidine kinase [Chloroflexi bacterium]|nr:HAMP domain-containing histidine kinase [Chloroflexota bacterium]
MRWKWLLTLIPALLGLIWMFLGDRGIVPNPRPYLVGDLGVLLFLGGLIVAALAGGYYALWASTGRKREQALAQMHAQTTLQAAEERRRFLRRLDHELKNPLTAIRAGLANLTEAPSPDARHEALESIDAQTLRLSRLASDLRKLAELETRPLECEPVSMGELLEELLATARERPEAGSRRLTLTLPQAPWPLPEVDGDGDLLFLALHNLLDNACKFTRAGDTVEVRAYEDGASVVVEVADTGPGISEEDIAHVWEELYRGESARGVPGSGLGLALVRAVAERHGGQVNLRSRAGQGTVFTLRLPARQPATH